ncbi:unnamed protein product [Rotaria socialis]|uniref:Uncharacterized protein n=1 Tax=Rotaria socialis TaxID=392032 RepID=A0A817TQC7_9BILA|nr:unnamed protein product [Rotaria socialis]CAF4370099.1 unnamed protein product [Rotaria socialis]
MSKETRHQTFKVVKLPSLHLDSNHRSQHRHYEHNTHISSRDDDDAYETKSISSISTRSLVSSEDSVKLESSQVEIVRRGPPINHLSQHKVRRYQPSSSIVIRKPTVSVPVASFGPSLISPSYPLFRKGAWIPSKTIVMKDAVTQKSVSIQTKLMGALTATPSAIGLASLMLVLGLAIITIAILAVLFALKNRDPSTSSNTFNQLKCATTCVMSGTPYHSSVIALWRFDGNLDDLNHIYDGTYTPTTASATYVDGNIGQALVFDGSHYVIMNTQFLNLSYQSWTIEGWFWLNTVATEQGIFSQCQSSTTTDQCLTLSIKNGRLYSSFYNDDLTSGTILTVSSTTWYHLAFVYDYTLQAQSVYYNGVLIGTTWGSRTLSGPYRGISGDILIGRTAAGAYFQGKMDNLEISSAAKSACEILNDAILTAYYSFDIGVLNLDLSNNFINGMSNSISTISGIVKEAYLFNQTLSYFQSFAFTAYSTAEAFSVSLWIKPFSVAGGTLIHLSTNIDGGGTACFDLLGFSSIGQLIANMYNSYTASGVFCPCYASTSIGGANTTINVWTHIVVTYGSTNGMAIYTNGTLTVANAAFNSFPTSASAFTTRPYMTVGNYKTASSASTGCLVATPALSPGSYYGIIDELRVYSRELAPSEICSLFNY